ncbi:hypothetical protein ACLKA7_007259 [Drosophila subpalustris]
MQLWNCTQIEREIDSGREGERLLLRFAGNLCAKGRASLAMPKAIESMELPLESEWDSDSEMPLAIVGAPIHQSVVFWPVGL